MKKNIALLTLLCTAFGASSAFGMDGGKQPNKHPLEGAEESQSKKSNPEKFNNKAKESLKRIYESFLANTAKFDGLFFIDNLLVNGEGLVTAQELEMSPTIKAVLIAYDTQAMGQSLDDLTQEEIEQVDQNFRDTENRTLLHYAVLSRNPDSVKACLRLFPNIDINAYAQGSHYWCNCIDTALGHVITGFSKCNSNSGLMHKLATIFFYLVKSPHIHLDSKNPHNNNNTVLQKYVDMLIIDDELDYEDKLPLDDVKYVHIIHYLILHGAPLFSKNTTNKTVFDLLNNDQTKDTMTFDFFENIATDHHSFCKNPIDFMQRFEYERKRRTELKNSPEELKTQLEQDPNTCLSTMPPYILFNKELHDEGEYKQICDTILATKNGDTVVNQLFNCCLNLKVSQQRKDEIKKFMVGLQLNPKNEQFSDCVIKFSS